MSDIDSTVRAFADLVAPDELERLRETELFFLAFTDSVTGVGGLTDIGYDEGTARLMWAHIQKVRDVYRRPKSLDPKVS